VLKYFISQCISRYVFSSVIVYLLFEFVYSICRMFYFAQNAVYSAVFYRSLLSTFL